MRDFLKTFSKYFNGCSDFYIHGTVTFATNRINTSSRIVGPICKTFLVGSDAQERAKTHRPGKGWVGVMANGPSGNEVVYFPVKPVDYLGDKRFIIPPLLNLILLIKRLAE